MKTLTKKQLMQKMQISSSTLQNYLNNFWFDKLKETGYYKRQKIITPHQLLIIKEIWGDFDE